MTEEAHFLFVEDRRADAELQERELRAAGLVFTWKRVDTEVQFRDAVREFKPHLIICDYTLPGINGMAVLQIARELCPHVPFIFVSGTMGEDRAVEALKNGAADYVLKDRLGSLPIRVRRALQEAEERQRSEVLEDQLRQAQKVEVIGRLAGGVAHDFNNLLTVISGYTDLTLGQLPEQDPLREDLEEIRNAAQRAAELTRQLLAFGRRQILTPKVIDLNAVVAGTEKMLHRLIEEDIELVAVPEPELWRVKADAGQIEQVIMNLAINARDAMPDGGRLTLETQNVELDDAYARAHVAVHPGPYVMLAVSDTGSGMDQETLGHLFEPFFTTKGPGQGTGLGLATVYGIVKQSGGNIWVYSEVGQGTTFKVYLPRVDAPLDSATPLKPSASLRGTETILLVEDERGVRLLARRVLEGNGYAVLEAAEGLTAIELVRHHEGPIHLLVTDVVMPHMSGRAVADAVTSLRPTVKVLYLSGYTANAIVHRGVLDLGTPFLEKPFTPGTLVAKVREVLDFAE